MVRSHFVQFWEGKDEIMAFTTVKQFTFALAADLFFSLIDGPQFQSLRHDIETFAKGIVHPPINFPGTVYYNAKQSRDRVLHILDTIICQRRKVNEMNSCQKKSLFDDQSYLKVFSRLLLCI
jgi:cytochrome P450 family 26 subfamily A